MAFDATDPADLAALKSEQATDPISMGYAAVDGQTNKTLALFNNPDLNVGGETTGDTFTPRLILDVVEPSDLTPSGQFSQGDLEWIKMVLEASSGMDDDLSDNEAKFRARFAANDQTITNLDARTHGISRAEVLFGDGTVISKTDWFAARDS